MSSKTVLITGAAGFIGSHLTEHCLARGWRVRAVDAFTQHYDQSLKRSNIAAAATDPRCTVVDGDLLQLDPTPLLDGADAVFHLAGQPGIRASWDDFDGYVRANVVLSQRLLDAVCHLPLERFVLASSSSVYGDADSFPTRERSVLRPVSPYGVTKVACEQLARIYSRTFKVPTVTLRYFTVYGPRQRPDMAFNQMISRALHGEPFVVFGDGDQTRDFTFVNDAVEATANAAEAPHALGRVYNVGGGARRSMNDVLTALSGLLGVEVSRKYMDARAGDVRDTGADISSARRDLGFDPMDDFEAALEEQLCWQRQSLAASDAVRGSPAFR